MTPEKNDSIINTQPSRILAYVSNQIGHVVGFLCSLQRKK